MKIIMWAPLLACVLLTANFAFANGGDTCPGPLINSIPYFDSTGNTTNMNGDYAHCGAFAASRDVVYSMNLSCDYTVTASLCGSSLSSVLEVRTTGSCPGDSLVGCNSNTVCPTGNSRGVVTFHATAGVNYYILVYGRCSPVIGCFFGNYQLFVNGTPDVPANDQCPGPLISSVPYNDQGGTCGANSDYANCAYPTSPDVVYTLNLPECRIITVSLCGSNFDTQLTVNAGGSCPGTNPVVCSDDTICNGVASFQSVVRFLAQRNVNYYILVSGFGLATGHYMLNVDGPLYVTPNDFCPGATIPDVANFGNYFDAGITTCAHHDFDLTTGSFCYTTTSGDVVYNYTPPTCQSLTATLCGSGYDTELNVRAGGGCPGAVSIACDDDYVCSAGHTLQSQVTFDGYAGVTYYVIISGYQGAEGGYVFSLNYNGPMATPAADVCPGVLIPALPYTDIASTSCMVHNYHNFQNNTSRDAIYSYASPSCQNVSVSLCGSGYDTGISVYRDGSCPGTTLVAGNDDSYCGGNATVQSNVAFQANPGITYFIIVHGFSTASGPYVLNMTGQPCNELARVDSLVIQSFYPPDPDVQISWASQGPAYYYYVYRSPDWGNLLNPANRVDSTTDPYFYNSGVLNLPGISMYYAVTAAPLPSLLAQGGNSEGTAQIDKATASPTSEAVFVQTSLLRDAEIAMEKAPAPPVYEYFPALTKYNSTYTPNPSKSSPLR
ncbi:MAG TPA: hypothetical protein VGL38_09360 [bacterium]|jgi:hypothetical protein